MGDDEVAVYCDDRVGDELEVAAIASEEHR